MSKKVGWYRPGKKDPGSPFNPRGLTVERVEGFTTGATDLPGEESVLLRINDYIFRFAPGDDDGPKQMADGLYDALLALEELAAQKAATT